MNGGNVTLPEYKPDAALTQAFFHNKSAISGWSDANIEDVLEKISYIPGITHPTHVLILSVETHKVVKTVGKIGLTVGTSIASGCIGQAIFGDSLLEMLRQE
jgi:hypothetical protein